MATSQENRDFVESIFGAEYVLDQVIDWININLKPEDVFDDNKLQEWADSNQ